MTTKQEEFDKLLAAFVSSRDEYHTHAKRAEMFGTDADYARLRMARQRHDVAKDALDAFVSHPRRHTPRGGKTA